MMRDLDREIRERHLRLRSASPDEVRHANVRGPLRFHSGGGGGGGAMMGRRRASAPSLDLFSGGTVTRTSTKIVQSGAETLVQYAANVRAIEDRGDGRGSRLSIEPAHANRGALTAPRAGWTAENGASYTALAVSAPLASLNGATLTFGASADSRIRRAMSTVPADGVSIYLSVWARVPTGTGSCRVGLRQKDGATYSYPAGDHALSSTWTRIVPGNVAVGAGVSTPEVVIANGSDGVARTIEVAYIQAEQNAAWAGSYTDVPAGAATTTVADRITYAAGEFPDSFRTNGFRMRFVMLASSASLATGQTIVSLGTSGVNGSFDYFLTTGGAPTRQLLSLVGVGNAALDNCTWNAGDEVTVEIRPAAGTITRSGFATGNGITSRPAWTPPVGGTLGIGSALNNTFHAGANFYQFFEGL